MVRGIAIAIAGAWQIVDLVTQLPEDNTTLILL